MTASRPPRLNSLPNGVLARSIIHLGGFIYGRAMSELAQRIGARIRDLRERRGLTQDVLAERCGVYGPNVVSRWESGRQVPRLGMAAAIASALGVTLDSLVSSDTVEFTRTRSMEAEVITLVRALSERDLIAVHALVKRLTE
jgi:transcriptional regulator with XRE-family HTH domain